MFARQVRLAREIATFVDESEGYELLAKTSPEGDSSLLHTHIIVIFRAKDDTINNVLVQRINATKKMYVSGTKWNGNPASRIAISTWKVDVRRDFETVKEVLTHSLG